MQKMLQKMLQSRLQKHCKTLQKMLQSTLKNKFNTEGSHDQWYSFKRQRNCCLNIFTKSCKTIFQKSEHKSDVRQ